MTKYLGLLWGLLSIQSAFAGVTTQLVLHSMEGARLEMKPANSADHNFPYAEAVLSLSGDTSPLGKSIYKDSKNSKNNTKQDQLRHFTVILTGQANITQWDSVMNECLAGAKQMKSVRGQNQVLITAETDSLTEDTSGGVAVGGKDEKGDSRSLVHITRLDPSRKYASVTFLNPKGLKCKFLSAGAALPVPELK